MLCANSLVSLGIGLFPTLEYKMIPLSGTEYSCSLAFWLRWNNLKHRTIELEIAIDGGSLFQGCDSVDFMLDGKDNVPVRQVELSLVHHGTLDRQRIVWELVYFPYGPM